MTERQAAVPQAPATSGPARVTLAPGDPAPWFHQRCTSNPAMPSTPPRGATSCCASSALRPTRRGAPRWMPRWPGARLRRRRACFFGVTVDPRDEARARRRKCPASATSGISTARSAGSTARSRATRKATSTAPSAASWLVLDPTLRVLAVIPFARTAATRGVFDYLGSCRRPACMPASRCRRPCWSCPNVFEPEFCRQLSASTSAGGEESGFMREVDGKTVALQDHSHKRRRDY